MKVVCLNSLLLDIAKYCHIWLANFFSCVWISVRRPFVWVHGFYLAAGVRPTFFFSQSGYCTECSCSIHTLTSKQTEMVSPPTCTSAHEFAVGPHANFQHFAKDSKLQATDRVFLSISHALLWRSSVRNENPRDIEKRCDVHDPI